MEWGIEQMQRKSTDGFVTTVHWLVTHTADDGYVGGQFGTVGYTQESHAGSFIPYEELTPEIVVDWVKLTLGSERVAAIEAAVLQQIEAQRSPPISSGLPW